MIPPPSNSQTLPLPPSPPAPLPRNVKLLGWASFLNDVASEMIVPLLPTFLIGVLGGSKFLLGLVEGAADSVAALLKLWSGHASDRAGARKGFVVIGYLLAALTRPVIGLTTAVWQVLGLRVADRVGKGLRSSPRDAMIADAAGPEGRGRAFGFHQAMDHLGAAAGPLLAGGFLWWRPDALRELFLLSVIPGLLVTGLVLFGLKEAAPSGPPAAKAGFQWSLAPFGPGFRLYLAALVVFTLGTASDTFLLVRAGELGVAVERLPILWLVLHLVRSVGNLWVGRAVDRLGARPWIIAGWIVYAGVFALFGLADAAWQAWVLFASYGLFSAFTEPAQKAMVGDLVAPERKGLAYGWFNFATGIAVLPAGLLFGWIYEQYGAAGAFGWGAAMAVAAAAMMSAVRPAARAGGGAR